MKQINFYHHPLYDMFENKLIFNILIVNTIAMPLKR